MSEHAINNVLQIFTTNQEGVVAMTTFDGGETSEEFMKNYDYSLKKLITVGEFEVLKENKETYLPHAVFGRSKTPEVWEPFVEKDLEHYSNTKIDRTYVIVRCFEKTDEEKYLPIHVDVEDHIKMPQMVKHIEDS